MTSFKTQPMVFIFIFVGFMSMQPMIVSIEGMGTNAMDAHKPLEVISC
jgi:hypothetical protein